MNFNINNLFQDLKNKKICFLGYARTNRPLVKLFANKCLSMEVRDRHIKDYTSVKKELEDANVSLIVGENYLENIQADIVFRTPGFYFFRDEINKLRRNGVIVTSEMEMFFRLCPCKIIGITGSDGKTTTTSIIANMLKNAGFCVHVGGNIGKPLLPIISSIKPEDYAVVELSSFQLISMRESPDIAVITNISPNHLDVHKNMEEYIQAKEHILSHQSAFSSTILNADNAICSNLKSQVRGKLITFSRSQEVSYGAYLRKDGIICLAKPSEKIELFPADIIKLPGFHNLENYLAAISALSDIVPVSAMRQCAATFNGVPHRIELIRELNGIKFYDDTIATTPSRTISGTLSVYDQKIILICGGYDKKIPFQELGKVINDKVKTLILLGNTSDKIEQAVCSASNFNADFLQIIRAQNMEYAVKSAYQHANSGDIISLSPACASFDLYENFEAKGEHFKSLVNSLK